MKNYEFIINNIIVTLEEFALDASGFTNEEIYELFITGSVTVDDNIFEIKEIDIIK